MYHIDRLRIIITLYCERWCDGKHELGDGNIPKAK